MVRLFILDMFFRSCKWLANRKDAFLEHNSTIPAETMDNADTLSVPLQSSSPITRLCWLALDKIFRSSLTSTVKVDCPFKIESPEGIRVKMSRYGEKCISVQGTNMPACAMMTAMPQLFMKVLFPAELTPYNNMPSISFLPNVTSLATNSTHCWILSTMGWRRSLISMKLFSLAILVRSI